MVPRKRDRAEMESSESKDDISILDRLRNMWEFSNLMQYIYIFGKAVKIDDDLTIEVHTTITNSCNMSLPLEYFPMTISLT